MPLMRISLRADTPAQTQRAIADGVHRALVDAIGTPEADRFQIIEQFPAEALIADPTYLGVSRQNVVFVNIALARGRSSQKKAALFAGIAKHLAKAGVRGEDVFVTLTENGRDDWSVGNGQQQLLDDELLHRHGWIPPTPTS
ncbi:MAG TPA: tautomerase family protein [Burkholderiales bacterium]|nr:tautomerase family protein [Burkholderiales bacterium]